VKILIALVLLIWSAVFAAVVVEGHAGGSTATPAAASRDGTVGSEARQWMILERTAAGWRPVRGPFAGAEACLLVRDSLNNQNTGGVFDCDEISTPRRAAAAGRAGALRTERGHSP
jgi:hypothetical protein